MAYTADELPGDLDDAIDPVLQTDGVVGDQGADAVRYTIAQITAAIYRAIVSDDVTMAAGSNDDVPTKSAVAAYVTAAVAAAGVANGDKGDITVSGGGATWTVDNDVVTNAKAANMATATIKGRTTAGTGDPEDLSASQAADVLGQNIKPTECLIIAVSDEGTALTAGTAKVTFRMPYAFTLTDVRASVTTAPTGGTLLAVDINESGTTILSTKLTFDASEKTTTTAATPRVISDASLADDAEMTVDIDAVGSTIAGAGLKVYLIGHRT